MDEYIDREAAIEKTEAFCDVFVTKWTDEKVLAWIKNLPAADVAPVVRCRNCKWWDDSLCTNINGAFCVVENGDWFCAS